MTSPEGEDRREQSGARDRRQTAGNDWRRARRGLAKPDATDQDWHRVRILAKQLRYTCDAVSPIYGKPARGLAKQAEAVQEVLGEHQDAVIAADTAACDGDARGAGTVAFTLGVLHSRQTEAAASARAEFRRVWADASRSRHRKWLVALTHGRPRSSIEAAGGVLWRPARVAQASRSHWFTDRSTTTGRSPRAS